jgi:hypothetical protein
MEEQNNPKKSFKERWLDEDKKCEHCGNIAYHAKGICRQNLKRLITPRFDFNELLITFIIIMVCVISFAYKAETQQSRDWLNEMTVGGYDGCINTCDYKSGREFSQCSYYTGC